MSIALDHTNLLGNTLAEIAHEKAGIVKEGSTVVSWPQEPSAMEVVEDAARRVGDQLVVPDFSLLSVGKVTRGAALLTRGTALEHEGHTPCSDSPRFAAELRAEHAVPAQKLQASSSIDAHRTPMSQVESAVPMRQFSYRGRGYATRLLGSYQPSNAAMAIEIAGALRERGWEIPDEAIARGIAETRWPARFEVLDQPAGMPTVVIDGGHNPQGAGVLVDSLWDVFPDKRPVFLVGILADKDYRSMLRAVAPLASAFVCVTPPNPRALDAVDLARAIRETCGELGARATIEVAGDFDDAVSAARKIAGPEGLICAFGSLYSIADVKAAFLRAADSNSLQP